MTLNSMAHPWRTEDCAMKTVALKGKSMAQHARHSVSPHGATMAQGASLRQFAASFPMPGPAYQDEIERRCRAWDFLDQLFDQLDRQHAAKSKRDQEPAHAVTWMQPGLPGL